MYSLHIRITSEHIENGVTKDPGKCPVALAAQEQYSEFADLRVGNVSIYDTVTEQTWRLPENIATWVEVFDSGGLVFPIEFDAEPMTFDGVNR